jgi:hypothetical protein
MKKLPKRLTGVVLATGFRVVPVDPKFGGTCHHGCKEEIVGTFIVTTARTVVIPNDVWTFVRQFCGAHMRSARVWAAENHPEIPFVDERKAPRAN